MFTGIIEQVGTVQKNHKGQLWIEAGFTAELAIGQSVAVNGVCLTVVHSNSDFSDLSDKSNLKKKKLLIQYRLMFPKLKDLLSSLLWVMWIMEKRPY